MTAARARSRWRRIRRPVGAVLGLCGALGLALPVQGQPAATRDAAGAEPAAEASPCSSDPGRAPLACRAGSGWTVPPPKRKDTPAALSPVAAISASHNRSTGVVDAPRERRSSRVALSAMGLGLLAAIPGAAIGAAVDRALRGEEARNSPALTGAFVGGSLGYGLGGVVGAHLASGGKGDIRVPLAVLGAAAPIMALDLKAGFAATLAAVSVAITIEN